MTTRRLWMLGAQALVVILIIIYGGARYFTKMPGTPHEGPLPPLTAEQADLAVRLQRHVAALAGEERNLDHPEALERAARYIEDTLRSYGFTVHGDPFLVDGRPVRNIEAVIEPDPGTRPRTLVVGAHYDSARGSPGANNNASGTAVALELARLLASSNVHTAARIRLVFFVNEEPPYFQTEAMGSRRYARQLSGRKEPVEAMYSLETLGYYSNEPGSQKYPLLLDLVLPDRGDFVAFFGLLGSRGLVRDSVQAFRAKAGFPSVGGAGPSFITGITWSDHWAFAEEGFPAVMITGTAHFRYPHYRRPTDTPDKLDYEKLARVAKGIEAVIRDAASRS